MPEQHDSRWSIAQDVQREEWLQEEAWQSIPRERRRSEWDRHFTALGMPLAELDGLDVLDVGCGPTSVNYFSNARRRVGLDPLAETYRQWNGFYGEPIELVESMAESMPFSDGEFDVVVCVNCIDHASDPFAILRECARVVKTGGRFVFHVDLDSPLRKLVKKDCRLAHPHSMHYREIRAQIERDFIIVNETRDPEVFRATRSQMRYEAYWDGLLYRLTKSDRWRNHMWLLATRR